MTKRVLSLLLVLVMALSLSVPAFADGEDVLAAGEPAADAPATIGEVEWIPVKDADDLDRALANKQTTINVQADFPLKKAVTIDYSLVLNLGPYQIDVDSCSLTVQKGASVTVNATLENGKLGGIKGDVTVGAAGTTAASLTVNSGYVTGTVKVVNGALTVPASSTAEIYKVGADSSAVGGSITIAGGKIGHAADPEAGPVVNHGSRDVSLAISGGEFVATDYTVSSSATTDYITGGKFTRAIVRAGDAVTKSGVGAMKEVNDSATYVVVTSGSKTYTVVGKAAVEALASKVKNGDKIDVYQGDAAFTNVTPGASVSNQGTGTVTVDSVEIDEFGTKYVASIGSRGYKSLAAAVEAASAGDTITLLANVDMQNEKVAITIPTSLTLNLNKKILTTDSSYTLTFGNPNALAPSQVPTITVTGDGNIMGTAPIGLDSVDLNLDHVNVQPAITSGTGKWGNSLTIGAESTVVTIGSTTFDPKGGTVTINGTVNSTVNISGVESEVVINDGATIKGLTTLGTGKVYMAVTISGGTFEDNVKIDTEEHAPVAVTGGTFKGKTKPIECPDGVVSGGIYNTKDAAGAFEAKYVKLGSGAAVITDYYTKNTYKYSEWTFVGDAAIAEGVANIAKGKLQVTKGTVTLASIGNNVDVEVEANTTKATLKVGNVTLRNAATTSTTNVTVTGERINELNEQIAIAQRAQVSGKLTDAELQALVTAYTTAISARDSGSAVKKSIDDLKKALAGYEDEETPTAPASGTGWVETASGEWYYFLNGKMVQNQWVESGRALWYYMNPDGTLAHGGFTLVPTCRGINKDGKDAGTFAAGYFYLRHNNYNGCIGQARHGSVAIEASTVASVPAKGTGVFETKHNGHYGACVSLNGKAVKNYTELPA